MKTPSDWESVMRGAAPALMGHSVRICDKWKRLKQTQQWDRWLYVQRKTRVCVRVWDWPLIASSTTSTTRSICWTYRDTERHSCEFSTQEQMWRHDGVGRLRNCRRLHTALRVAVRASAGVSALGCSMCYGALRSALLKHCWTRSRTNWCTAYPQNTHYNSLGNMSSSFTLI